MNSINCRHCGEPIERTLAYTWRHIDARPLPDHHAEPELTIQEEFEQQMKATTDTKNRQIIAGLVAKVQTQAFEAAAKAMCDDCKKSGPPVYMKQENWTHWMHVEQWRICRAAPIYTIAGKPAGVEQGNLITEPRYVRAACPCLHTTPCAPNCTCVSPASSRGCRRCCSYGSIKQQREKAERLAGQIQELTEAHAALRLALPILQRATAFIEIEDFASGAVVARDAVAEALGEENN